MSVAAFSQIGQQKSNRFHAPAAIHSVRCLWLIESWMLHEWVAGVFAGASHVGRGMGRGLVRWGRRWVAAVSRVGRSWVAAWSRVGRVGDPAVLRVVRWCVAGGSHVNRGCVVRDKGGANKFPG